MKKLLNISTLSCGAVPALLALLLAASPAEARQLSAEEALQNALAQAPALRRAPGSVRPQLAFTARQNDLNTVYVFNRGAENGFMVVAADDVAETLLGYSETGTFNPEQMPENLQAWLNEYSAQIATAAATGTKVISAPVRASYADIAPICKTQWDQGYPFNNDCPTDEDDRARTYTGCVATAMAQILKTYNYPEHGVGENTYYCSNIKKSVSFDYAGTNFDWANMINVYPGTAAQNAAVATLMSACGVSVNMMYGTNASGAFSINVAPALIQYFNYDISAHFCYRRFYSLPVWMDMIYNELQGGYPVYYSGQAADGSGGHAFVLDGYRASDAFVHINWGWSGMSDGYFRITTLEPSVQGAGGAGAGFSDQQGAIFSLRKPVEGSVVYPNLTADADFGTKNTKYTKGNIDFVTFTFGNAGIVSSALEKITYELGVRLIAENGGEPQYLWKSGSLTTAPNAKVGSFPIAYDKFPTSGNYTITPVFRYNGQIYDLPIPVGDVNSLKLVAEAKSLTFEPIVEQPALSATDIEVHTPMYAGEYARFSAEVTNNGAEYFGKIVLAFTGRGATNQIYATIPGPAIDLTDGETELVEFVGSLPTSILTENCYVVVATEDGQFLSEKVAFKLNPKPTVAGEVSYVSSTILNAVSGRGTRLFPYVVSGNPLQVEGTFKCTAGEYFADNLIFWIGSASSSSYRGYPSDVITLLKDQETTFTMNISDYSLEEGGTYRGGFGFVVEEEDQSYLDFYEGVSPVYFRISAAAGIEDVVADTEEVRVYPNPAEDIATVDAAAAISSVEAYSLSGALALNARFDGSDASVQLDVTSLAPGMYVLKVNTAAGVITARLVKK